MLPHDLIKYLCEQQRLSVPRLPRYHRERAWCEHDLAVPTCHSGAPQRHRRWLRQLAHAIDTSDRPRQSTIDRAITEFARSIRFEHFIGVFTAFRPVDVVKAGRSD